MTDVRAGTKAQRPGVWKDFLFLGGLLIGMGIPLAGMWFMPTYMRLELWIGILILLLIFSAIIGYVIKGRWIGILIDQRNKVSLSKFQTLLWLIVVLSAFVAAGLSNLHMALFGTPVAVPLAITLPPELLALLAVSATSFVGTAFILHNKGLTHKLDTNDEVDDAAWSDMFKGDDAANCDAIDLSKVQMFYLTLILVLVYGAALAAMFLEDTNHAISALPALSATMVALLGMSHAGYLGYKAIPHNMSQPPQQAGGRGSQQTTPPDQGNETTGEM